MSWNIFTIKRGRIFYFFFLIFYFSKIYFVSSGPCVEKFAKKLVEECERFWKDGKQKCDSISMTGRPCTKALHTIDNKKVIKIVRKEKKLLVIKKPGFGGEEIDNSLHSSDYKIISYCNCGESS
jgi:hypothetical protein